MSTPPPVRQVLRPDQLVPLDDVRTRFTWIWIGGFALSFIILVVQSLLHVYDPHTEDAWLWFLPNLLPTLGLIVTVLTFTALDPYLTGMVVRKSFVPVAQWLSVLYLFTVLLTILIQPFAAKTSEDAIALMRTSNLWLGPFQGLVASSLGVLFASKENKDGSGLGTSGGNVTPAH